MITTPSGRLAQTLPRRREDAPSDPYFFNDNGQMRYNEGLLMGYRGFIASGTEPLAPFGFGLSYTEFTLSSMTVAVDTATGAASAEVSVSNQGDRAGRATVQLYVTDETGTVSQPPLQLAAFAQCELSPGASETVSLTVPARAFAHWDVNEQGFRIPAGTFLLRAGNHVADLPLSASVIQQERFID